MAGRRHREKHYTQRIGWLRAAVLGANDGVISTASLMVGLAGASRGGGEVLLAGIAAMAAGAMSMAAGEFVSVSSQADTERADLDKEKAEIAADPEAETRELAGIYEVRGLDKSLARQVAEQLMAKDALEAHARDELGISEVVQARPVQAAVASAGSFIAGAVAPVLAGWVSSLSGAPVGVTVTGASLVILAILGALGARTGGAPILAGVIRVTFWGAVAMAVTAGVGALIGKAI